MRRVEQEHDILAKLDKLADGATAEERRKVQGNLAKYSAMAKGAQPEMEGRTGTSGVVLEMQPHGAKFEEPVEVTVDVLSLVKEDVRHTRSDSDSAF